MFGIVIDLALVLVVLALITGVIWGVYAYRHRGADDADQAPEPVSVEYARTFFPVIVIVLVIRSFAFEPFRIPSSSMLPTLETGDFIFVNKYVYGLRLPVLNTKILELGEPKRGDVVVFRLPSDNKTNYIKRVVGLPGDTVVYRDRQLYINDEKVPKTDNGTYRVMEDRSARAPVPVDYIRMFETLGEKTHDILRRPRRGAVRPLTYAVPEGHYFVMGDNRDNSKDSRFTEVGFVPEGNLVGRAVAIWFHWEGFGHWPDKWSRIGDRIN